MATMEQWKDMAAGAAQKATEAAQNAAKAAKYVAFVSKKKFAIAAEQEKIRRAYTRLGKVYYKDYVTDEEPDQAEYAPICDEISTSYRKINALKDEIADAKAAYTGEASAEEADQLEALAAPQDPEEAAEAAEEAADEAAEATEEAADEAAEATEEAADEAVEEPTDEAAEEAAE